MKAEMVCLHAILNGRVQGVGFRYFVRQYALQLGLAGWVRNLHSGAVELRAEGPRAALEQLVLAMRQGPPGAVVDDVNLDWSPARAEFTEFTVAATAD